MRTKFKGIITCPGLWPGIEANTIPMAEKPRADRVMHAIKASRLAICDPKNTMPTSIGIIEIPIPYRKPASVLPMRTASNETGEVRNLSNVWLARSLGMVTGPMDDDAKKSV